MHLYWRIQQDLNCLGEIIVFHDPGLIRSLRTWLRKNYPMVALAEGMGADGPFAENPN